jgi:hypothetical protein
MGNVSSESAAVLETPQETVSCDQYINKLNKVAIENVSHLPNASFNLCSLTQMIAKGLI